VRESSFYISLSGLGSIYLPRDGSWKCAKLCAIFVLFFFVFPADIKVLGFPGLAKVGGNRSQLAGHAKLGRGLVNKKILKI
jgi:hypothetical protein